MIGSEDVASDGDPPSERMMNALDLFLLLVRHGGLRRFVGTLRLLLVFVLSLMFLSPSLRIPA